MHASELTKFPVMGDLGNVWPNPAKACTALSPFYPATNCQFPDDLLNLFNSVTNNRYCFTAMHELKQATCRIAMRWKCQSWNPYQTEHWKYHQSLKPVFTHFRIAVMIQVNFQLSLTNRCCAEHIILQVYCIIKILWKRSLIFRRVQHTILHQN